MRYWTNAGFTKKDICFVQILLDDIDDFTEMNRVYEQWLPNDVCFPARAHSKRANYLLMRKSNHRSSHAVSFFMPGSPYFDDIPKGILTWPILVKIIILQFVFLYPSCLHYLTGGWLFSSL